MTVLRNSKMKRTVITEFVVVFCIASLAEASDPNLVANWKFDEGVGTTAYDSAGSNHGTLINEPNWTTGQSGGALQFDGVDDYVEIPDSNSLRLTNAITVAVWTKADLFGNFRTLVSKGQSGSHEFWFGYTSYNKLDFKFNGHSGTNISAFTYIADSDWHHLVGVYDGNDIYVFIDGAFDSTPMSYSDINDNTGSVNIGYTKYWDCCRFKGLVDEVSIYNRPLTGQEIIDLYNEGLVQYTISGRVTFDGFGLADVDMVGLGVVTDANGDYSGDVISGSSCTVIPTKAGYTFYPDRIAYSDVTSDQMNQDYTASARDPNAVCPSADLNGDCFVDFEDFAVMAAQWPTTDFNDLRVIAAQWLTGYPNIHDDMAYIPGGEFDMGHHYDVGGSDGKPVHTVYLDAFFMSKYEITNQQYCDFLNSADVKVEYGWVWASSDSGNSYPYLVTYSADSGSQITYSDGTFSVRTRDANSMAEHPVLDVSWYGAVAYCNWRSGQEGYEQCYNLFTWECDFSKQGYRLPTEAEWEYAARGGCHDPYYMYPWCNNSIDCSKANGYYCNPLGLSDEPYTSPVGYYGANNYGLFDMAGNVWEWCNDWYDSDYYGVSPYDNPRGPTSGTRRVLRGGGWRHLSRFCWVANRNWTYPAEVVGENNGIRVVLDF